MQRTKKRHALIAVLLAATVFAPGATLAQQAEAADPAERKGPDRVRESTGETQADDAAELARIQEKIRMTLEDAQGRRKAQNQRLRDIASEKKALDRTVAALAKEVEAKEKTVADKKSRSTEIENEKATLETETQSLLAPALAFLERVKDSIEAGIPWQKEGRIQSIDAARKVVESTETMPAGAIGALVRLQKEEEALGRLVEASTVQFEHEGEMRAVQAFHLGLLAVIYADDNHTLVGYCAPGTELADGVAAVKANPEAADGYVRAVEMLQRRRSPALTDIYLPKLPLSQPEGSK